MCGQRHVEAMDLGSSFGRGSVLPLVSGCELFVRFVSRTFVDFPGNFQVYGALVLHVG